MRAGEVAVPVGKVVVVGVIVIKETLRSAVRSEATSGRRSEATSGRLSVI